MVGGDRECDLLVADAGHAASREPDHCLVVDGGRDDVAHAIFTDSIYCI